MRPRFIRRSPSRVEIVGERFARTGASVCAGDQPVNTSLRFSETNCGASFLSLPWDGLDRGMMPPVSAGSSRFSDALRTRLLWAAMVFVLGIPAAAATSVDSCLPPPLLTPDNIGLFASDSSGACDSQGSTCPVGNVTLQVVTLPSTGVISPCGGIYSFHWQLGDGTDVTTSTQTLDHLFSTPGLYTNTVTVTPETGGPATTTRLLLITQAVPAMSPFPLVLLLLSLVLVGLAATR